MAKRKDHGNGESEAQSQSLEYRVFSKTEAFRQVQFKLAVHIECHVVDMRLLAPERNPKGKVDRSLLRGSLIQVTCGTHSPGKENELEYQK